MDGLRCFNTWKSQTYCENLFPHSLRQRRHWHSGGMLTDTDSGLKPQWCIFLTLLLTHRRLEGLNRAPSCGMQTFLNPGERLEAYSSSWRREARGDGPGMGLLTHLRVASDTRTITQYHHNTFFPQRGWYEHAFQAASCLLKRPRQGFQRRRGPRLQKCLLFPTSFTKQSTHDVTKWCFYGTNAERGHKTHPWTFMEAHQASCVVHKITVFTVF